MPIDLDELERLEREATPGPWKIAITKVPSGEWEYQLAAEQGHAAGTADSDFNLIAATRNALPDLIAELSTLRALLEERDVLRDEVERLRARVAEMESPPPLTMPVRTAARKRFPLDGADAQALEGALRITEQERDEALARVAELEEDNEWLRRTLRASCVRTPTPGCDCPGCETARERAAQVDIVASYEDELEEDRQAERDRILGARVREIARQHDARLDPYGFARAVMRAMEESDE